MYIGKLIYSVSSIILIIFTFVISCSQTASVPQQLIGKWETSALKYTDRYLEFGEYYITFGFGEDMHESHYIRKINQDKNMNGISYSLIYEDSEGEKWPLAFSYTTGDGEYIKLKNSDVTWKKVNPGEG